MNLSDPLTGVYKAGSNPPFGKAKANNQNLEIGDRFIIRNLITGRNTVYSIEKEEENPTDSTKLEDLSLDFGEDLIVENGTIKSKNMKLITDIKVSYILSVWQNKADTTAPNIRNENISTEKTNY